MVQGCLECTSCHFSDMHVTWGFWHVPWAAYKLTSWTYSIQFQTKKYCGVGGMATDMFFLVFMVVIFMFFIVAGIVIFVVAHHSSNTPPGPGMTKNPGMTGNPGTNPPNITKVWSPPSQTGPAIPAAHGQFGSKVFAPYWDTSSASVPWSKVPTQYLTLAFIIAGGNGQPMWNGTDSISSKASLISSIRSAGKDVIVSFGGESGQEIGLTIKSVPQLAAAYMSIIRTLSLKWVDFDIEEFAVQDATSIARRNQALAIVQKTYPNVIYSYTLGVMPTGLTDGLNVLKSAKQYGVRVDVVNIMTMYYGSGYTHMGSASVSACNATLAQLASLGMSSCTLGITPNIGINKTPATIFTLADAATIVAYAQKTSKVRWLSFWNINKDNGNGPLNQDTDVSSGIHQSQWAFSQIYSVWR